MENEKEKRKSKEADGEKKGKQKQRIKLLQIPYQRQLYMMMTKNLLNLGRSLTGFGESFSSTNLLMKRNRSRRT